MWLPPLGWVEGGGEVGQGRGIERSSVLDPKLIISDPDQDPDPQIENQEFRIRILDPDPSVTRDGEKKIVNFGDYEDTNGLKSLTF